MGPWIWGAAVLAIVVILAGGVAWWLARGCVVTLIGAGGAVVGGVVALGVLPVMLDFDAALLLSSSLTIASGVWLLAFALAGGIRGQRALREEMAAECLRVPVEETVVTSADPLWPTPAEVVAIAPEPISAAPVAPVPIAPVPIAPAPTPEAALLG